MDKKSRDLVMGKLFLKNKDYKMAEKSFSEYLSSNPEDYQALKMLAQVQEHLNDTAKAFDLYQRCYLAQPDRKGVLLDICRLLLIRDARLDDVDQRKWLKLASQSFPTNPIVTNLRESIPNGQDSHPSRNTTEDPILKKLISIEDRIKSIEDKLTDLSLRPHSTPTKSVESPEQPKVFGVFGTASKFDSKPASQTEGCFGGPNLFAESIKKINLPAEGLWTLPKPAESLWASPKPAEGLRASPKPAEGLRASPKPAESLWTSPKPAEGLQASPKPAALKPAKEEDKKENHDADDSESKVVSNEQLPIQGGFSLTGFTGVNLFAESMKKNNLPAEGLWTLPKPATLKPDREEGKEGEYDADDNDSEVVNNEELPIENFCDMKPIEIKSGEEDEDIVFEFRCKLFRFRDKEYKERGLGNIKVLKHRETGKGRLIMRREQINLVCLNCWSCTKIERVRDTQVRFAGLDASDGDPISTIFLAKFGTQQKTDEFMNHLTDLFPED